MEKECNCMNDEECICGDNCNCENSGYLIYEKI